MKWIALAIALAAPTPALAQTLAVTLTATSDRGQMPTVSGTTNLPDGMILSVSMYDPDATGVIYPQNVTVEGGKFKTRSFTEDGGSLQAGAYFLQVDSEDLSQLPASVLAVIGQMGQNMSGPAVSYIDYPGSGVPMGAGIDFSTPITVP